MLKSLCAVLFIFSLVISTDCRASCVNPFDASCSFYESCLEQYCPCRNTEHSYAIDYGMKYCKRFLSLPDLSMFGTKWRESTLRCLQEVLVPELDLNNPQLCNCESMKSFAIQSHVKCYTQQPNSICFLPAEDHEKISRIIDNKDLFDAVGWQTMWDIAQECVKQRGAAGAASSGWNLIKVKVEGYLAN